MVITPKLQALLARVSWDDSKLPPALVEARDSIDGVYGCKARASSLARANGEGVDYFLSLIGRYAGRSVPLTVSCDFAESAENLRQWAETSRQ